MKSTLVRLLAFLSPLALSETATAQQSASNISFNTKSVNISVARYAAAEADLKTLTEMKALSPKLFNQFTRDFKSAYDIKVYTNNPGKKIQVNSKTDGDMNRTMYSRKGQFIHNIKHYDYTKLPAHIADIVNDAFPRYEIFGGVAEIKAMNKVAYLVLIETSKSWKRVKVLDREVEVYEEFNKSNP